MICMENILVLFRILKLNGMKDVRLNYDPMRK